MGEAHQNTRSDRRATQDRHSSSAASSFGTRALPRPFLHFSAIRLTKYSRLEHYKYIGLLCQEFVLQLDQSFMLAAMPFLDVFIIAKWRHQYARRGRKENILQTCASMRDLELELGIELGEREEMETPIVRKTSMAEAAAALLLVQQTQAQRKAASAGPSSQSMSSSSHASAYLPPASPRAPPRASAVASGGDSWMEGIDCRREVVRTRHGNPLSAQLDRRAAAVMVGRAAPFASSAAAIAGVKPGSSLLSLPPKSQSTSRTASPAHTPTRRSPQPSASPPALSLNSMSPRPAVSAPPAPVSTAATLHPSSGWVSSNPAHSRHIIRSLTWLVDSILAAKSQSASLARARAAAASGRGRKGHTSATTVNHSADDSDPGEQIYYLENVEINSQCVFSFFTLPSAAASASGGRAFGGGPDLVSASTESLSALISSKSLMVANTEDAHLALTGLHITHSFTTLSAMGGLLSKHYHQQLSLQLFELVGAAHVLGNPIGLLSNLGTGVFDLVNEPVAGAILGPAAFGRGLARGLGSFVKYSVYGLANTASSLVGTLGNASATLSADPEYLRQRKRARMVQPRHVASGLAEGGKHLAVGVFEGLTGIFTAPVAGARAEGALGLLKGVGRGLLGVVVKPVTGVFDAVSTLTTGIKNTTTLFDDRVRPQRATRILYGPDQVMRIYSAKEAAASCFLDTRGNLRLEGHQRETYADHFTLELAPSKQRAKENEKAWKRTKHLEEQQRKRAMQAVMDNAARATSTALVPSTRRAVAPPNPQNQQLAIIPRSSSSASAVAVVPSAVPSPPSRTRAGSSPPERWTITFCLTDHSLVCLKLDLAGASNAAAMNSSSSAARSTSSFDESGAHSGTAGSSSSSSTSRPSRYARILGSAQWISIVQIERSGACALAMAIRIPPSQRRAMINSDRMKQMFTFSIHDPPITAKGSTSGGSAAAAASASHGSASSLLLHIELNSNTPEEMNSRVSSSFNSSSSRPSVTSRAAIFPTPPAATPLLRVAQQMNQLNNVD
jgi:hypothetical protein